MQGHLLLGLEYNMKKYTIELNVSFLETIEIIFPLLFRVMVFFCVMITQNLKENLLGIVCCLARYVSKSV